MEKIKKIECIGEFNDEYVYDLEVDKVHNFCANNIVVHNTDSVFVQFKGVTNDNIKTFEELENRINQFLKRHWESQMKKFTLRIECETIFNTLILPQAKKTYIGLTSLLKGAKKNNELYSKGFSLIRRDVPAGLKPLLQKFYNNFLINVSKNDMNSIKSDLRQLKKDLKSFDYTAFLIAKQINNEPEDYKTIPQHVRSMLYSNKYLGTDFSRANYKGGMLFCKVSGNKYPQTECIMLSDDTPLPNEMSINYDKYFDLFVKSKICLLSESFEHLFSENRTLMEFV